MNQASDEMLVDPCADASVASNSSPKDPPNQSVMFAELYKQQEVQFERLREELANMQQMVAGIVRHSGDSTVSATSQSSN